MANQRFVVRLAAVASIGAAVFCLTQGATANTADYPIRVSGQWWGPKGNTGLLNARLAQDGDALSGVVSAPSNADLDGVSVSGSAADHVLSLQAASRGTERGSISGQVYGDALFGTYTTANGESGSWMGSWSADPPRIADQWPPGAQLLAHANVPDEPARLSSLTQMALDDAQTTSGAAAAANGATHAAGPLMARSNSGFGFGALDDLVRGFGNWFEQDVGGGLAEAVVTVGANQLVNNPSDNSHPQNTPEVAIDRISNPNKIAVGANDRSFNQSTFKAGYYFSTDGGATWPAAGRGQVPGLSAYLNSGNASLTFDANGRVFYAGSANNGTGSNLVFVAQALSGNITYQNTIAAVAFSANGNTEFEDKPWLAVNRTNGYVYVCWTKATSSFANKQIWLARSTDNGANFTTTLAVSDDLNSTGCSVAVEPDGTVDVAWIKNNNQIMFDRCTTSGTTLSCGTDLVLSRDASGQPTTFKACTSIPTGGVALTGNSNPTIAVDSGAGGNGYRAVVWCVDTNTLPPNLDTYFTLWNPNTATWLTPKAIASTSNQQEFFPTITIDDNHLQQVLFYRKNPNSDVKFNAYITLSGNGSGNFSTPQVMVNDVVDIAATNQVNDGKGIGDYIGIDGSTTRQPAWMDSRGRTGVPAGTQQDIYTATASGC